MKLDAVVIYTDRPLSVIKRQQPASLMTGGEESEVGNKLVTTQELSRTSMLFRNF